MMTSIVVLAVLVVFSSPASTYTYPVFGTKRYHRTGGNYATPMMRAQPVYTTNVQHYYEEPPNEDDDSYYYYPPNHHSPDHTYGLPTYRGEYKPTPYYYAQEPSFNYYDDRVEVNNPMDDLHEEIMQEDQRERDMVDQQEDWYESPAQPPRAVDETMTNNFLRNLIMYNKQIADQKAEELPEDFDEDYTEEYFDRQPHHETHVPHAPRHMKSPYLGGGEINQGYNSNDDYNNYHRQNTRKYLEDKEVKELQQLTNTKNKHNNNNQKNAYMPWSEEHQPAKQVVQPKQNTASFVNYEDDPEYDDDAWINWDSKRSVKPFKRNPFSRQPVAAAAAAAEVVAPTTKAPALSTMLPSLGEKLFGQKEVVLPRPATPVKNPFASPVLDMLNSVGGKEQAQKQPKATVYDSIKHLITMQQNLQKQTATNTDGAPKIQRKRFVSNEESLVEELEQLKRRDM